MILLIQIQNIKIHYLEFVKPIEDVLKKNNINFESLHYKKLDDTIISRAKKIIISGTSLKDNAFLDDLNHFDWIKNFKKPILGICGGMHILGLIFGGTLKKQQEIGLKQIILKKEFLGEKGTTEVYELHNFYVESSQFEVFASSKKCSQVVKHKNRLFYGVLFHPEVRNKDLITNFTRI